MGLLFVKQCNPGINWTLGTLEFDESNTLTCHIHLRHANVKVIHTNARAREIMREYPSTVIFFFAILRKYDATLIS
jgi:hypothetical protein